MKKLSLAFVLFLSMPYWVSAQYDEHLQHYDTYPAQHWEAKGHFGVYGSFGYVYMFGNLIAPQVNAELGSYYNTVGYWESVSRITSSITQASTYSLGCEYLPMCKQNIFCLFDFGMSKYSYSGTVNDAISANSNPPYNQTSPFNYNITMLDINARLYYSILKWHSGRLSPGLGMGLVCIYSQISDQGDVNELAGGDAIYNVFQDILSVNLRLDSDIGEKSLLSPELYWNYFTQKGSNALSVAGLRLNILF